MLVHRVLLEFERGELGQERVGEPRLDEQRQTLRRIRRPTSIFDSSSAIRSADTIDMRSRIASIATITRGEGSTSS